MSGYQLDPLPTWSADELRVRLTDVLRRALGPDRERLKALDCATWLPEGMEDAAQLEHRGLPHGPVVQVVAYLASSAQRGKTMRVMIPTRMRWDDVERMGKQMALTIRNAVKRMRIEESQNRSTDIALPVRPLAQAIGAAVDGMTLQ